MRVRRTVVLAVISIATVALVVGNSVCALTAPSGTASGTFAAVWPVGLAVMALVGAFVATRRPENATGWLFLGGGALLVLNAFGQSYSTVALTTDAALPAAHLAAWLGLWTWAPGVGLTSIAMVVFPSGHARSRFWRTIVIVASATSVLTGPLAVPALRASTDTLVDAPSAAAVPGGALFNALNLPILTLLVLGYVAVFARFRRAQGIERLQMKWFVYGTALIPLTVAAMLVMTVVLGGEDPINNLTIGILVTIGFAAIPVSAASAILRYRLYDIDRIISRTLSYAVVTALLAGTFAAVALVPAAIVGTAQRPDWLVATATLVAAALFRPVRRRVQSVVDHRFNRRRYDAEHTVEAFAARLREQIDIDALGAELCAVVNTTMQPSGVSLWLPGKP